MIQFLNVKLQQIAVHIVGNKTLDEEIILSKSITKLKNESTVRLLLKYFLSPFTGEEMYNFSHETDLTMNETFMFVDKIFNNKSSLLKQSENLAKHLYQCSVHPKVKSGEFYVVYFSELILEDEITDAIGLFKSETKDSFLKVSKTQDHFEIDNEDGINANKLDKGCLIFNTSKENGYKVCIIDNSNKAGEAQYWKDSFLQLKPCGDDYHFTKEFLNITKNYVTTQLSEEFEVSKADKIDLLNRSVNYFKSHDTFDKDDFEKEVFQDKNIIKSFQNFDETYREDNEIEVDDNFDISASAVKKQSRIFKSVLKLDKNFHIYIHGDRDLIEQGTETDGRKFYKIYFDKES